MSKDISQKRLEEYNDLFVDIFNNIIFGGKQVLEEEGLSKVPTESYIRGSDGKMHENRRDIHKSYKGKNVYRLVCGIENQSQTDNTMPERVMGYEYAAYESQIQEIIEQNKKQKKPAFAKRIHGRQKLVPVITGVLYFGNKKWDGPMCLHDMLQFPDEEEDIIKPMVANYHMNLIQVSRLSAEVRGRMTSDFRLIADYLACRRSAKKLVKFMKDNKYVIKHPEAFLDLMSEISGDNKYKIIKENILEEEREGMTMCVIADKLVNQGIQQGIQQGVLATLCFLVNTGVMKREDAARTLKVSVEELDKELQKCNVAFPYGV